MKINHKINYRFLDDQLGHGNYKILSTIDSIEREGYTFNKVKSSSYILSISYYVFSLDSQESYTLTSDKEGKLILLKGDFSSFVDESFFDSDKILFEIVNRNGYRHINLEKMFRKITSFVNGVNLTFTNSISMNVNYSAEGKNFVEFLLLDGELFDFELIDILNECYKTFQEYEKKRNKDVLNNPIYMKFVANPIYSIGIPSIKNFKNLKSLNKLLKYNFELIPGTDYVSTDYVSSDNNQLENLYEIVRGFNYKSNSEEHLLSYLK